ncbi:MAG: hypothetical protein Q8R92_18810 [Deltaproteobacteria bacterium]|nr:hypothetical protein [Deltaproteobacteria bacterium]
MANNVAVTAGTGTTFKTTDTAGVHTGHVNVDTCALPSGASTAAKQPALGTAGTASTDVISVQGIASMTPVVVDGSGVTQPVSGTVTADLGATDNAVLDAIEADTTTLAGAVSGTEMQVDVVAALPAGTNAIGKVKITNDAGTVVDPVEQVAHDAVDSGDPVKTGGKAVAGLSGVTLVAAADRTDAYFGLDGAQITRPHCGLEDIVTGNASNTDGTSTACIAAGAAGIKHYLTAVELVNSSTSDITVDILDGATVKWTMSVPANGGNKVVFPVPIPGTAATAWNFDPSAATTTVTCSMIGFKSKV